MDQSRSEGTDNLAILRLGERFQGLGGNVSECSRRQAELRTRLIARKLGNQNRIVVPHGQVPRLNLSPYSFSGFLRSIESRWTFLDF